MQREGLTRDRPSLSELAFTAINPAKTDLVLNVPRPNTNRSQHRPPREQDNNFAPLGAATLPGVLWLRLQLPL